MNLLLKQKTLLMVRALYFCMENKWAELGKQFNISPAQQHILFLLSTNNKLTPKKIGELGCWHASTVTRLLKRLEKSGLIDIKVNKTQSRFKIVSMTNKGKALLDQLLDAVKYMDKFPLDMHHLSEKEILRFLEYGNSILDVHKGEDFKKNVISKRVDGYNYV